MRTLTWLIIQQPRKMLNLFISQYVTGIYGLPIKGIESKRSCCHEGMVSIHAHMDPSYIYQEYMNWLSFDLNLSVDQKQNLRQWVCLFHFSYLKYTVQDKSETLIQQTKTSYNRRPRPWTHHTSRLCKIVS